MSLLILPVGGVGSRFKGLTKERSKGLFNLLGKENIGRALEEMLFLKPDLVSVVVGHDGTNVEKYLRNNFGGRGFDFDFVYQDVKDGDGGATRLSLNSDAVKGYSGPVSIRFATDTLASYNQKGLLKILNSSDMPEALIMTDFVQDSSMYGLVFDDNKGNIYNFDEATGEVKAGKVAIGEYHIKNAGFLREYLNALNIAGDTLKGGKEYKLAQFYEGLIEMNLGIKTFDVDEWIDTGNPELLLKANRKLLEREANSRDYSINGSGNVKINHPCYIGENVSFKNGSEIGPYVSIPDGAVIGGSVRDSIFVGENVIVDKINLCGSILGEGSSVVGSGLLPISRRYDKMMLGPNKHIILPIQNRL